MKFDKKKHIHVQQVLPARIHGDLKKVRSLILDHMHTAMEAPGGEPLEERVSRIEKALGAINKDNGILKLPFRMTPIDAILIFGAPNARSIKEIVPPGVDMKFHPGQYKKEKSAFRKVFGCECPKQLLMTLDFMNKLSDMFAPHFELDGELLNYIWHGVSIWLLTRDDPPDNALIYEKYGYQELNYLPYARYGSDTVTYGLLYDYHLRRYATAAYYDLVLSPCDNIFEPLVEKFTGCWDEDGEAFSFLIEEYGEEVDELLEILSSEDWMTTVLDEMMQLQRHAAGCCLSSYLKASPAEKQCISGVDVLRYIELESLPDRYRKKLNSAYKGDYLFGGTMPTTPIPGKFLDTTDHEHIANILKCVSSIAELYSSVHPGNSMGLFEEEKYKSMRGMLAKPDSVNVIRAERLRRYVAENRRFSKKRREEIFSVVDEAIREIFEYARLKTELGADGYGFMIAMIFWDNCVDGALSRMAADLLAIVDKSLCPDHIKETAKRHAATRHDALIPT